MNDLLIVIEIDDSVDVVAVPAELAMQVRSLVPEAAAPRLLETVALLIARLGPEAALPAVHLWIERSPNYLIDFPAALHDDLASGEFLRPSPDHFVRA